MNKIGIYFAYWEQNWQADYCHYIKKVQNLGFDTLELAAGALTDMPKSELSRIADTANEYNMDLTYCIGLPPQYDIASTDVTVRKNGIDYVKKLLHLIHYMGGDMLGGIIYSCWPATTENYDTKLRAREMSMQSLKEILKLVEDYNIDYCLEIVNRFEQYLLNTAAEGASFVKEMNSPKLKLLLDTFHMNIEEDFIGDAIRNSAGYIGHFHIGECNRKTPGSGHMPWDEIMTALKDINYQGRIVMEPFIKIGGEVGRDIKMYHDLSNNADESSMDTMAKAACEFIRSKISK